MKAALWKPISSAPKGESKRDAKPFLAGVDGRWPVACYALKKGKSVRYFRLVTGKELSWVPSVWTAIPKDSR